MRLHWARGVQHGAEGSILEVQKLLFGAEGGVSIQQVGHGPQQGPCGLASFGPRVFGLVAGACWSVCVYPLCATNQGMFQSQKEQKK